MIQTPRATPGRAAPSRRKAVVGRRALPVFTGLASLTEWRADARPVPMSGARVIAAALEERYDGLVIDVAGPAAFVLEPAELRLLARARS